MEVVKSGECDVLEELGLTLGAEGRLIIVTQASAQSEQYGIIPKDRISIVNNVSCEKMSAEETASLIQK